MMIDTTAQIVHDCACTITQSGRSPTSYENYRGFLIHKWSAVVGDCCVMSVEMPTNEAASILGVTSKNLHQLGTGEITECMPYQQGIAGAHALVDRFWENLGL